MLAQHAGDLPLAVAILRNVICPAHHEAEEQDQRGIWLGSDPLIAGGSRVALIVALG